MKNSKFQNGQGKYKREKTNLGKDQKRRKVRKVKNRGR